MKAIAYSVKSFEKEFLAKSNQKKHEITLISNILNIETAVYASGKAAVLVFTNDDVSAPVIDLLAEMGVRYIATRSVGTDHIDLAAAARHQIEVCNVSDYGPQAIAEHTLALALALSRKLILANAHSHRYDFRNDELVGFNFSGKTVGIIGLGKIGQATAGIFSGMGCHVIANDPCFPQEFLLAESVSLDDLLTRSDIISLHLPLNVSTKHLINRQTLGLMKDRVMLINTSRGALINTLHLLYAIESGKVGYLGMDVYEYEKGLFFEDHEHDLVKEPLLRRFMQHANVLITPHQGYLTCEALQSIADKTIANLDRFQVDLVINQDRDILIKNQHR